jgi:hypothetical protein
MKRVHNPFLIPTTLKVTIAQRKKYIKKKTSKIEEKNQKGGT